MLWCFTRVGFEDVVMNAERVDLSKEEHLVNRTDANQDLSRV